MSAVALAWLLVAAADPGALADRYVDAVEDVNRAHAEKPGDRREPELAEKLPAAAAKSLDMLLAEEPGEGLDEALLRCGEAALDLDLLADFERVRARLLELDPASAAKLGIALSRSRFVARGLDGVETAGLAAVADAFTEVLDSYEHTFGFQELSKVPGKKLRLRVHLVPVIEKPPHFAPQFPWHSEIDFPVISKTDFASPTEKGQFLLYGLAHELGHVVAMWGSISDEEDHHAWAHYLGVAIVEDLAARRADAPALKNCRDKKWRALRKYRAMIAQLKTEPGTKDRDQMMALYVALHDLVGPGVIGKAINTLDASSKAQRVNRVRYYRLADFRAALLATPEGKAKSEEIEKFFPRPK